VIASVGIETAVHRRLDVQHGVHRLSVAQLSSIPGAAGSTCAMTVGAGAMARRCDIWRVGVVRGRRQKGGRKGRRRSGRERKKKGELSKERIRQRAPKKKGQMEDEAWFMSHQFKTPARARALPHSRIPVVLYRCPTSLWRTNNQR